MQRSTLTALNHLGAEQIVQQLVALLRTRSETLHHCRLGARDARKRNADRSRMDYRSLTCATADRSILVGQRPTVGPVRPDG